jgi:Neuraminidase (sialidase)
VSVSHDEGRTWTTPRRIYGSNTENQNHVPLELADDNLVDVFAEAYRLSLPASSEQIRVVRSTDGGKTWSSPVPTCCLQADRLESAAFSAAELSYQSCAATAVISTVPRPEA